MFGSIAFVAEGASAADQVLRGSTVFALGALFALAMIARVQPLAGLMWFAALDVVVFFAGPGGASWSQDPLVAAVSALIGIGVGISFAFMPEVAISLAAFAVVAVQIIGAGVGYLPGSFVYSISPIIVTLIGYWLTGAIRKRVAR